MLTDAQEALATHVETACEVDNVHPTVPNLKPQPKTAYVHPGEPWVQPDDTPTYCGSFAVNLVVDFLVGTADLVVAQEWLADRVDELFAASINGVEVATNVKVYPVSASAPGLVLEDAEKFLGVQVAFSSFRWSPT